MKHDVNLNIHYTAPDEIWDKIGEVYRAMSYWDEKADTPHWGGFDIDLWTSVELSSI